MQQTDTAPLPVFELATERGWTRGELARRAGLSIEAIDKLRSGSRGLGLLAIRGFRRAFPDKSLDELFGEAIAPLPEDGESAA